MDDAELRFAAHPELAELWHAAKPSARNNAMQLADEEIDRLFSFRGRKAVPKQKRKWPRIDALDDDGQPIEGIPEALTQARDYLAGCLLAGSRPQQAAVLAQLLVILQQLLDPEKPFTRHFLD